MAGNGPLQPVDAVEVTVLVDNAVDILMSGNEVATRAPIDFGTLEPERPKLLAEHGLSLLLTVERVTAFERGLPGNQALTEAGWEPDPWIRDDQAVVAHVRGRGLVVLSGCSHAGAINVLRQTQRLTGEDRVHAFVGGMHLSGPAFEPLIPPTLDELEAIGPDWVVPGHCTGWRAQHELARRMPDAYVQTSVGTRLRFS